MALCMEECRAPRVQQPHRTYFVNLEPLKAVKCRLTQPPTPWHVHDIHAFWRLAAVDHPPIPPPCPPDPPSSRKNETRGTKKRLLTKFIRTCGWEHSTVFTHHRPGHLARTHSPQGHKIRALSFLLQAAGHAYRREKRTRDLFNTHAHTPSTPNPPTP